MKNSTSQPKAQDPEIEVDIKVASDWYSAWQGFDGNDRKKWDLLNAAIENVIIDTNDKIQKNRLFASKNTWGNWKNWADDPQRTAKRPKSLMIAFLRTTGVDISKDRQLSKVPQNFTPIVILGNTKSRNVANAIKENEQDEIIYEIELEYLKIKYATTSITKSEIVEDKNANNYSNIGTCTYRLFDAFINIIIEDDTIPSKVRLVENFDRFLHTSDHTHGMWCGINLIKDRTMGFGYSIFPPPEEAAINGDIQRLFIAKAFLRKSCLVSVRVSGNIEVDIDIDLKLDEKEEKSARNKLIGALIGQRFRVGGQPVLSMQTISIEC